MLSQRESFVTVRSTVSSLLSCSCTGQANIVYSPSSSSFPHNQQLLLGLCPLLATYRPKHPSSLSPCVRWYSVEPCSRSIHSLIFGTSLCVHLPSFDESHSSCHLVKRVSLAFARMMFRSRGSNLIGGTPERTLAASLDNVRHALIMRKFILRYTAPICLSTKYAGMQVLLRMA